MYTWYNSQDIKELAMALDQSAFTTKIATGSRFCNREAERAQLSRNIEKGEHTVIVAPRRFGKTSLVCQTLHEMKIDCTKIDLFCVVYASTVCEKITKGVSELVKSLVPFTTKALTSIENCFKHINIILKSGKIELQANLSKNKESPIEQIIDVLSGLEKIAKQQKKRVVVFIDEFQDMLKTDQSNEIQAAIRGVAQHCEYVSFVFSGSSRNMLKKIFEDRNQPLYMLCQKIHLKKIPADDFTQHIQKLAKKKWKKIIENNVIDKILYLTQCHPYYLNVLCDQVWESSDKFPTINTVNKGWDVCLSEQKDKLIADLEPLNTSRIKVLTTIANRVTVAAPTGKEFVDEAGLALATVQKTVQYLLEHDYIYEDEKTKEIQLIDPLLQRFIKESIS